VYGFFAGEDRTTTGLISGKFDGTQFVGHATFGDMPARWHLSAMTNREGIAAIAQGTAEMFVPSQEGWSPVGDTRGPFSMAWQSAF
jgi:hypothetical protein